MADAKTVPDSPPKKGHKSQEFSCYSILSHSLALLLSNAGSFKRRLSPLRQ